MSKTIEMLKRLIPANEQETKDIQFFIDCENIQQILTRENERCHLCASVFITNKKRTKVLCVFHNIYKSWSLPGGHADGDDDMLYVAKKELKEETVLKNFKVLNGGTPIAIDSLPVAGHMKRGKYVPAHCHLNVTYLFEANESENVRILEEENSNVGWLTFEELIEKSTEPHMVVVFKKVINKIKTMNL